MSRRPSYLVIAFPMLIAAFLLGVGLGLGNKDRADGRGSNRDAASNLWTTASPDSFPGQRKLDYARPYARLSVKDDRVAEIAGRTDADDGATRFDVDWDDATERFLFRTPQPEPVELFQFNPGFVR